MLRRPAKFLATAAVLTAAWHSLPLTNQTAEAAYGWEGQRRVSHQDPHDLFYNYYVGPGPSGAAAQLYVSPLPVPEHVGHTYNTYQPFYPHEYMYGHQRAYYSHQPGAGWTRTNVRYNTGGGKLKFIQYRLNH
ncbi:hypothetical protein Pla123a_39210 [Posidoniimonas polymericola]|uniref:Uncharacterized protein n=1 Tax=Posidoniimonas polymericola TaxID=2528002 RepID=A0A5C5YGP6_9BACT|nr:hypothetical protein [Posidoniimonas polymericola]TWT73585.1 hypothetical protein Pla123a_39210 [Posidoniimonas polymericola]